MSRGLELRAKTHARMRLDSGGDSDLNIQRLAYHSRINSNPTNIETGQVPPSPVGLPETWIYFPVYQELGDNFWIAYYNRPII
jgi:hypothetical protein